VNRDELNLKIGLVRLSGNIDATYDLVQKGLQAFVDNYKKPEQMKSDASA